MPILPPEPDCFPEDLLDCWTPQSPGRWWALHTLARREKDLMRRLRKAEVSFYGPLVKRRSRTPSGRHIQSHLPLFPGYVFLCGEESDRQEALKTNCIARCLPVTDGAELMHDLRCIRQLIAADVPLTPESRLQPGTPVRVRSGSMAGLEGVVIKRHGKDWLVVNVQFLQRGASVMLEDFQFEAI